MPELQAFVPGIYPRSEALVQATRDLDRGRTTQDAVEEQVERDFAELVSLQQDYRNHTSYGDDVRENCGEATPFLYSTPNLKVTSALVRRNVGTPTPMRGPGAVPGVPRPASGDDRLPDARAGPLCAAGR